MIGKGEEFALFKHYFKNRHTDIEKIGFDSAYYMILLEQTELKSLEHKERLWITRLNERTYLSKTTYEDLIFSSLVFYNYYEKKIFVHDVLARLFKCVFEFLKSSFWNLSIFTN